MMKISPRAAILPLVLVLILASPARAADDDDDWAVLGGALALIQQVVHVAAQSDDPDAVRKRVDAMIAGESPEANRVAARILRDMLEDVPPEQRATFAAIARDLAVIARREQAKRPAPGVQRNPAPGADPSPAPRLEVPK